MGELLSELTNGDFSMGIQVHDLPQATDRVERAANRLVLALLAFGLLVSSAIIGALLHTGVNVAGFAVLAIVPGFAGFCLIVLLLVGILRSGKW